MTQIGCFGETHKTKFELIPLEELVNKCQGLTSAGPKLQRWCSWRLVREEASALGLGGFVSAIESGQILPSALSKAFETNYSRWYVDHVVSADEVLRTFVSAEHEQRIAD